MDYLLNKEQLEELGFEFLLLGFKPYYKWITF